MVLEIKYIIKRLEIQIDNLQVILSIMVLRMVMLVKEAVKDILPVIMKLEIQINNLQVMLNIVVLQKVIMHQCLMKIFIMLH